LEKIKQTSSTGYVLPMYSWWKALNKVIKYFDKINIGKNKTFNKRVPHLHIKKMRHTCNKGMPMESEVENQKHLWWISDWDRSWWYHILANLLSMILHRSIYFSADTALGLSMESYPCKNRNTKCAVYLTIPWSTGHFRVPKTFTFKMRPKNQSPQLVRHCAWAIRHETLIKFIIITIIIIIISISKAENFTLLWYRSPGKLGNGLLKSSFHFSRRHACKSTKQWGISKFQKVSLSKC